MTAVASQRTLDDDVTIDQKGSVPAVQQGLATVHPIVAVHEAGIGQVPSFDAMAQKVRLRIKKRSFAKRIS